MNILPIPPLDGGKIALEIVERVDRPPAEARGVARDLSAVGALLLFSLIGYLMYADIVRIVTRRYGVERARRSAEDVLDSRRETRPVMVGGVADRRRRAHRRAVDDEHRHRATPPPRSRRSRASPTPAARSCASRSRTPTRSTASRAICAALAAAGRRRHPLRPPPRHRGRAGAGAAKLRINPGNIGATERVDAVIDAAGEAGIPIRIGVNAGSLAERVRDRDWPLADKLVASAVAFCEHFESRGFADIVVSAKASSVTVDRRGVPRPRRRAAVPAAPRRHRGRAPSRTGTVKSAVGLGILLAEGIGDTLRVSLTADPVEEVAVAWEILAALDIRRRGPELVSCPTCGRCEVDLIPIAEEVERRLRDVRSAAEGRRHGLRRQRAGRGARRRHRRRRRQGRGPGLREGRAGAQGPGGRDRRRALRGDRRPVRRE